MHEGKPAWIEGLHETVKLRLSLLLLALPMLATPGITAACDSESGGDRESSREKLAVVLGGGGARGVAHVGVLRVLEENGIYPDIVVGTSFGALVAGFYAIGYTPDEIEELLLDAHLEELYRSVPERRKLSFRRKQDDQVLLAKPRLRVQNGKIVPPSAIVSTHKFRRWLQSVIEPKVAGREPADFPFIFGAAATNLVDGEQVVIGAEDVEAAIHASMAFPPLVEPLSYGDALLGDGALVNNLPVSVALDLGATQVIAVEVGTPFPAKEEIVGTFAILNQLSKLMTRSNVERTIADLETESERRLLAGLGEYAVLLQPNVDHIGTGAFPELPDAISIGEDSARAVVDDLRKFGATSTPPTRNAVTIEEGPAPIVEEVTVVSDSGLSDSYLKAHIDITPGMPYSEELVNSSINNLYGLNLFERVSHQRYKAGQGAGVRFDAPEKPGRGFLQFGFRIEEDFETQSDYEIAVGFTKTQLNPSGAEWRTIFRLGRETGIESEFFQPFGNRYRYFWSADAAVGRSTIQLNNVIGDLPLEFRANLLGAGFRLGRFLGNWGQAFVSYTRGRGFIDEAFLPSTIDIGSVSLVFERDTLDSSAFPSIGERLVASHRLSRDSLGATIEGERTGIDALKFFSRDRNTLGIWATLATSYDDASDTAFADSLSAGGFLDFSGYGNRELSGRHLGLVRSVFYRRLTGPALRNFVDFPLYAGGSLEFGGIWQNSDDISFRNSTFAGSLFLGLDSIIGPLFLAVGLAEGGENAVYLSLGRPFIYDLSSEFE